jgi:predicted TIM-barrel fold metal-dependent hydrolase
MHVVDPETYPLSSTALYGPPVHTLRDYAQSIETSLGIKNAVLIQPSIYGTDNSCLLHALRELTPQHGRGVIEINPAEISQDQLHDWHQLEVRGVRMNYKSVGKISSFQKLQAELSRYPDVIRLLNWVLEIYLPLEMMSCLKAVIPHLGVKICIDHFGAPELPLKLNAAGPLDPRSLTGFASLIKLIKGGNT